MSSRGLRDWSLRLGMAGVLFSLIWWFFAHDGTWIQGILTNAIVFALGVVATYWVIEKKLTEDRRALLAPVEFTVLQELRFHCSQLIRQIALLAEPSAVFLAGPEEAVEEDKRLSEFVRSAPQNVTQLSSLLPKFAELLRSEFDRVFAATASLQSAYPFVFQEYPVLSKLVLDFRMRHMLALGMMSMFDQMDALRRELEPWQSKIQQYGVTEDAMEAIAPGILDRIRKAQASGWASASANPEFRARLIGLAEGCEQIRSESLVQMRVIARRNRIPVSEDEWELRVMHLKPTRSSDGRQSTAAS